MSQKKFYLLQVNDALFPIGAYSHSQGLETYIQMESYMMKKQQKSILKIKLNGILLQPNCFR